MTAPPIRDTDRGVRIDLRVIPRSSRAETAGVRNGRLLLRVTAPPVDGAANDAVVALLAELLGVARRSVTLVAGTTSRHKSVDVDGVDRARAMVRLGLA